MKEVKENCEQLWNLYHKINIDKELSNFTSERPLSKKLAQRKQNNILKLFLIKYYTKENVGKEIHKTNKKHHLVKRYG